MKFPGLTPRNCGRILKALPYHCTNGYPCPTDNQIDTSKHNFQDYCIPYTADNAWTPHPLIPLHDCCTGAMLKRLPMHLLIVYCFLCRPVSYQCICLSECLLQSWHVQYFTIKTCHTGFRLRLCSVADRSIHWLFCILYYGFWNSAYWSTVVDCAYKYRKTFVIRSWHYPTICRLLRETLWL